MGWSPPGSSVHGSSRQEYWSMLPFSSSGDLPYPGMEPTSLASTALVGGFFTIEPPGNPTKEYYIEQICTARILNTFFFMFTKPTLFANMRYFLSMKFLVMSCVTFLIPTAIWHFVPDHGLVEMNSVSLAKEYNLSLSDCCNISSHWHQQCPKYSYQGAYGTDGTNLKWFMHTWVSPTLYPMEMNCCTVHGCIVSLPQIYS